LSSEVTEYLFSLAGMTTPEHFAWKALAVYIVFAVASVAILKSNGSKITNVNEKEREHIPSELTDVLDKTRFIGRKKELDELEIKLEESDSVLVINGMGGIGKSSLAAAFLDKHKDDYTYKWFVEVLYSFVYQYKNSS
jgi:putative ribosome biogenesis GTPase RsgA